MLKKRKAKKSNRGLYLQDIELTNTAFQVGTNFKYSIDMSNRQIVIQPTDVSKNKVSKRMIASGNKPVIDIRNKEALAVFQDAEHLEVEIYEDQIFVTGYGHEEKQINPLRAVEKKLKSIFRDKSNVIDLASKLELKKRFEVRLSREQLDQVVGQTNFEQLSIFDYLDHGDSFTSTSIESVKSGLSNLKIPLQIISLFSGAGIMDTGFLQEGFDIAFALEIDKDAVRTYSDNIGHHIVQADITQFEKERFAQIGAPIMIGGSPCQGFSNSNRHSNFLDNPNNLLLKEFIESIKANKNCQVFVIENVPQLLTAGNGRFKQEIYEELSEFEITSGVLSSVDFGEAQDRKRAFIIGSKIGRIDLPLPSIPESCRKTVREAFRGLHEGVPNQLDFSSAKASTIERMRHVPPGGNWRDLPEHLMTAGMKTGKTHSSIYRRLEWDRPSITIANPRKSNITHPSENRILSVRECARLFGIADDFILRGSLSSMQQQICNSVPVKLARAIAKKVKNTIQQFNIRNGTESFQLL